MPNPDGTPTAAEAIAALDIAGAANQDAPQPIGVPGGYVAARRDPTSEDDLAFRGGRPGVRQVTGTIDFQVPARYFDGDDWKPASLSPDRVADLQRSLIAAGLIDKKDAIKIGVWDDTSRKGYRTLLAYANASGLSISEAINAYGEGQQEGDSSGRAPLQIRQSDPGELKQVMRKAVIDTLGTGWDESKLDAMVAAYQQTEAAAQSQAYAQEETGGTVTQPPSAASFAMQQAQAEDPTGKQAHDYVDSANSFFGMLKGVV